MLDAVVAFAQGEHEHALDLFAQVAEASEELGFVWQQASAVRTQAERLYGLDRIEEAEARGRTALALARRIGDQEDMAYALAMLAGCAARLGEQERAGRLWGAIEARQRQQPLEIWEGIRDRFEIRVQPAAGQAFETGHAAGLRLTLEEAVEQELADA
jgi:ATP/maltotriose-dependent transcriptional regulator MalT